IVGYSIIECKGNNYKALEYGCITTDSKMESPDRLKIVYDEILNIIDDHKPDDLAIEELFFNKNVKTAIMFGQDRGVAILAAKNKGLEIFEYTPLQIKQEIGRAS